MTASNRKRFQVTLRGLTSTVAGLATLFGIARLSVVVATCLALIALAAVSARFLRWNVEWTAASTGASCGFVLVFMLYANAYSGSVPFLAVAFYVIVGTGAGAFFGMLTSLLYPAE